MRHWADAINSYLGAKGFKAPTGLAAECLAVGLRPSFSILCSVAPPAPTVPSPDMIDIKV